MSGTIISLIPVATLRSITKDGPTSVVGRVVVYECGCESRTLEAIFLCRYHEGHIDGFDAGLRFAKEGQ